MSPRRKTVPPTRVSSRSSSKGRSELIDGHKTEKLSAKKRTALDNRFHRTAGKFSRAFESDVRIDVAGKRAGVVIRRRSKRGQVDVLECTSDLDRRVSVALALLILGSEP